jgi:hypothetical protein
MERVVRASFGSLPENKIVELSAQLDHKNRNVD